MTINSFLTEMYRVATGEMTDEVIEDATNYAMDLYLLTDDEEYIDIANELRNLSKGFKIIVGDNGVLQYKNRE